MHVSWQPINSPPPPQTKNGRLLFMTLTEEKHDLFEVKLIKGSDSAPHFAGPVTHSVMIEYEDTYYGSLAGIKWFVL